MNYDRIIFVCSDNTSRSIMAESVMNSVKKEEVEILSRGLVVLFPEPINPKVIPILKNFDLAPCKESSEELVAADLAPCTLVLAMTKREKASILHKFPNFEEVYTIGEFVGSEGDIEEPHAGSLADYGASYEYIDFVVKMLAEKLFR